MFPEVMNLLLEIQMQQLHGKPVKLSVKECIIIVSGYFNSFEDPYQDVFITDWKWQTFQLVKDL